MRVTYRQARGDRQQCCADRAWSFVVAVRGRGALTCVFSVGLPGFEPGTFGPPDQRANQAAPQPVHGLSRGRQCRRRPSRGSERLEVGVGSVAEDPLDALHGPVAEVDGQRRRRAATGATGSAGGPRRRRAPAPARVPGCGRGRRRRPGRRTGRCRRPSPSTARGTGRRRHTRASTPIATTPRLLDEADGLPEDVGTPGRRVADVGARRDR